MLFMVLASCNNCLEDDTHPEMRSLDEYSWVGTMHNDFLDCVTPSDFRSSTRAVAEYDSLAWQGVLQAQIAQVDETDLNAAEKKFMKSQLESYQRYYCGDILLEEYFPKNEIKQAVNQITALKKANLIDDFEKSLLNELIYALHANAFGNLTNQELSQKVFELCSQWEVHYSKITAKGDFSGYILSIAKASAEWWDEIELDNADTRAVQVIIGNDIIGGLSTAAVHALMQYSATGKIDWGNVALSGLSSAIISSTGFVGKLTKFIFRK